MIQGENSKLLSHQILSYRFRKLEFKKIIDRDNERMKTTAYVIIPTPVRNNKSHRVTLINNITLSYNLDGRYWGHKLHLLTNISGTSLRFKVNKTNEDDAKLGKN